MCRAAETGLGRVQAAPHGQCSFLRLVPALPLVMEESAEGPMLEIPEGVDFEEGR